MGNPSASALAPGAARSANQALIVVFERDEALADLLLGQLRAQGYEGRSARTPVEVFDLIARYPIRLALVNLGQAATSRREFWVALDAQRFGRGVQVITYRYLVPGVDLDVTDGSGRPDVEIRGPQGFGALIEAVRAKLPPPARPNPDSSFLVAARTPRAGTNGQPAPAAPQGIPSVHAASAASQGTPSGQPASAVPPPTPTPLVGNPAEYAARQQPIAGVLNLSRGAQPGQPPEFMPLSGAAGASIMQPANTAWTPEIQRTPPMPAGSPAQGATEQRAQQWMGGRAEPPATAAETTAPAWQGAAPRPAMPPGNGQMNGVPYNPSMPMGNLAALSDAINALAAAGVPGYQQAAAAGAPAYQPPPAAGAPAYQQTAAAANPMNTANNLSGAPAYQQAAANPMNAANNLSGASAYQQPAAAAANSMNAPANMPGSEAARWDRGRSMAAQEMSALAGDETRITTYPVGAPAAPQEERKPSSSVGGMNQMNQGSQPPARGAAETLYMGQQAFAELGRAQDARQQETRSRLLDDYEYRRHERTVPVRSPGDEPPATASRRLSGEMEARAAGAHTASYQNQMLAPVVAPGQIERSLGNVLVEGQLISPQRLEVAMGIQRLLRGVDIDYRLGEVLLLFKFLTHDQLLAAVLVSRGLVTPAQVASMGRIKQELHAIGMEYDLENLLILFRILTSEQLREIRSEFP